MGEFLELHPRKDKEELSRVAEIINQSITAEGILHSLKELQGPAPTGTVGYTRTPIVAQLMREAGVPADCISMHLHGSDTFGITLGKESPKVLFDAHADQISYLVPNPTEATTFEVMPNCAHRVEKGYGPFSAEVIRYVARHNRFEKISEGELGNDDKGRPQYKTKAVPRGGFSPGIDRVVFAYDFVFNESSNIITGNFDDAAGVAALTSAAGALAQIRASHNIPWADFRVAFVTPDGEEGLPGESDYFGRGARQLLHRMTTADQLPENVVIVDGHNANTLAPTAPYGAYISAGKGAVVPPALYDKADKFFKNLRRYDVETTQTELNGVLSRSNDVAYLEFIGKIFPFGYWIKDPHFDREHPASNLQSIVNCAKGVAWIAASSVL